MKKLTKQQKVINYLNENQQDIIKKSNQAIINILEKEFILTHKSAINYYYKWKKEFIGTSTCVPKGFTRKSSKIFKNKELKVIDRGEDEIVVRGKYNVYKKTSKGVKVGDVFFKSEKELNEYMLKEIKIFRMQCCEILDLLDEEITT